MDGDELRALMAEDLAGAAVPGVPSGSPVPPAPTRV